MIKKADFEQLEAQIDPYVKRKQLKSSEAQHHLDQYLELILSFFKMINEIDEIDFDYLDDYPVVPMNFKERYDYIQMRKYHFMGYRQMKTMKDELIKMNASYQIRRKREKRG
ncbi:YpoC family protein [Staphylococcus pettenkoferi]|uniref:YpoC family protein n=1 Tax=Staphylococcus pettenkoferi TaxID=170573 RepID=UPI00066CC050|nr:hypothetical protein [Staphylococcus pettenkoferi]MDK7113843.1 hypothetical protein [Staphylococcus pettenkoferi]MDK7282522.1 hypothetical protein [Staphylococcus pettenkoferi]